MDIRILCPFHLTELMKIGKIWKCPVKGFPYSRISCPYCGFVIRILPGWSYCLRCGALFSYKEVVRLYSETYGVSIIRARRDVEMIMSRYLGVVF